MSNKFNYVISLAALLGGMLQAQIQYNVEAQAGCPVSISAREGERPGAEEPKQFLELTLTNTGSKEIVGYVIAVGRFDASGRKHTIMFESTTLAPFQPGKQWGNHRVYKLPTPVRSEISVDYVLFSDESGWGPDTLKRGGALRAHVFGAKSAARAFQHVLETQGPQALPDAVRKAGNAAGAQPGKNKSAFSSAD
jgi:hypothetical protein